MSINPASIASLVSLAFVASLSLATPPTHALTLNQLVDPKGIVDVSMSPDGKHLAVIAASGENHGLVVVDIETMESRLVKQGKWTSGGDVYYSKEPYQAYWVANDRIALNYYVYSETVDLAGNYVADIGDTILGRINPADRKSPLLLARNDYRKSDMSVVDGTNGKMHSLSLPGSGMAGKLVFGKSGQLRAVTMYVTQTFHDVTAVQNWYRASDQAEWKMLAEFNLTDNYWIPVGVANKDNSLIVASSIGRDTSAIYRYDPEKREMGEMMAGHPTQDIIDIDDDDGDLFKSVATSGMLPQRYWFDSAWNSIQIAVDAALPHAINVISGNAKGNVLIHSYSDVDPGRWFVLTVNGMKMKQVAEARPQIDPATMHHMEIVSYPARDGLTIPAYLTRPSGGKGMQPAVVFVHGGPTVRDQWEWNPEVQLLADRGYVVLQPQFRGSSGFGTKFEQAGYRQWGLAMQDDIADGVDYLVKQGIVDPKRVCIYGASYGGYAALEGLVKTPDLYRCGISFAGVSDLASMMHDGSDASRDAIGRQIMKSRIGDLGMSQDQFDQVSPLKHADLIKAPLLLMHGERDIRVPISHSRKMKHALEDHDKVFEWIEFPREGHGFTYVQDSFKFYANVLKFLYKYNPPDVAPGSAPVQENEKLDINAEKLRNVVTF